MTLPESDVYKTISPSFKEEGISCSFISGFEGSFCNILFEDFSNSFSKFSYFSTIIKTGS